MVCCPHLPEGSQHPRDECLRQGQSAIDPSATLVTSMSSVLESLRAELASAGSLATAIRIGLAAVPAWAVVDVVVQDEFTHDVIFMADPAGPALVLDCT